MSSTPIWTGKKSRSFVPRPTVRSALASGIASVYKPTLECGIGFSDYAEKCISRLKTTAIEHFRMINDTWIVVGTFLTRADLAASRITNLTLASTLRTQWRGACFAFLKSSFSQQCERNQATLYMHHTCAISECRRLRWLLINVIDSNNMDGEESEVVRSSPYCSICARLWDRERIKACAHVRIWYRNFAIL
jgi:hypothetical protein